MNSRWTINEEESVVVPDGEANLAIRLTVGGKGREREGKGGVRKLVIYVV